MIKWMLLATLSAGVSVGGTGCATLFAPGPDKVHVTSQPDGAMVLLDGVPVGETPTIVSVPRDSEGVLTFELEGHMARTVVLDKSFNIVTLVNLAWGPIFPMIIVSFAVDAVSGDIGKYSESPIHIDMQPRHGR